MGKLPDLLQIMVTSIIVPPDFPNGINGFHLLKGNANTAVMRRKEAVQFAKARIILNALITARA